MSAKKQTSWIEAVHDAATGYAVVVLGVICFLLALIVIVAGVRVVVGAGSTTNVAATSASIAANAAPNGSRAV